MKFYLIRFASALLTFVMGLSLVAVLKPFRHEAASDSAARQEIMQVEHDYIRAHLERDRATLDRVLSDDFTIRSYCRVVSKAQRLALLQNPDFAFESINTDDLAVEVNGDRATLTGDATLRTLYGGEESVSNYRFMRTFEKRYGAWQIVSVRIVR